MSNRSRGHSSKKESLYALDEVILASSRSSKRRRLNNETIENISSILKECEEEVLIEYDEEWIKGWLKNMRKGIEKRIMEYGYKDTERCGLLAAACAASRARENILRARSRHEATHLLKLRAQAKDQLDNSQSKILEFCLTTPPKIPDDDIIIDKDDLRKVGISIRNAAVTAVEVTDGAKREMSDLSSMIDVIEYDFQEQQSSASSKPKKTSTASSSNPASRLARHLAQENESPHDFISSARPPQ